MYGWSTGRGGNKCNYKTKQAPQNEDQRFATWSQVYIVALWFVITYYYLHICGGDMSYLKEECVYKKSNQPMSIPNCL